MIKRAYGSNVKAVCDALRQHGPMRQGEIADATDIRTHTVGSVLCKLRKRGIIMAIDLHVWALCEGNLQPGAAPPLYVPPVRRKRARGRCGAVGHNKQDCAAEQETIDGLAARVTPLVEAFARALPDVRRAYVREDGAEFVLLGDVVQPSLCESAANLALALQRAFAPDTVPYIDGGYEPVASRPLDGFALVFEHQ